MKIYTPAKLNLFLKVLGKRKDGFHEIRSGITFINLYDILEIHHSDDMSIRYEGSFAPKNNEYEDCIIKKTLNFLKVSNKFKIKITKNIPVQSGLGSASSNAAGLIKGLESLVSLKRKETNHYVDLGSDVPSFLYSKNCLVTGKGEKIFNQKFPKYYFLLVKPNFGNSTKNMYQNLNYNDELLCDKEILEENIINENDTGNDFEKIAFEKNNKLKEIFKFLETIENSIFSRMSGSGSCCFSVFEKKEHAKIANEAFKSCFKDLWTCVCENNTMND